MTITLAQLRTQARQRADQENSNFVTDSELTGYINNSIAELHDLMMQNYESEYFIKTFEFNTSSGVEDYPLPVDFYPTYILHEP